MTALLHAAVDRGITFFDTAECMARSQRRAGGRAIGAFRKQVVIATKFGFDLSGADKRPGQAGLKQSRSTSRASRARSSG